MNLARVWDVGLLVVAFALLAYGYAVILPRAHRCEAAGGRFVHAVCVPKE